MLDIAFGYAGGPYGEAGLEERPGNVIPSDLSFRDEYGREVNIGQLLDKPVILTLNYFTCSHICPQMLAGLAEAAGRLALVPGKDFALVTLSFDPADTPLDARNQKINYLKAVNRPFPDEAWKFLTGDAENIGKISDAVGIGVKKADHGFVHPEVAIFIAPGGKIIRYLHVSKYRYGAAYPLTFSTVDLATALAAASQGKVGLPDRRETLYCFLYEPAGQEKFFALLKLSGLGMLLLLGAFFLFLKRSGKRGT